MAQASRAMNASEILGVDPLASEVPDLRKTESARLAGQGITFFRVADFIFAETRAARVVALGHPSVSRESVAELMSSPFRYSTGSRLASPVQGMASVDSKTRGG
jgi:hypothetical protein